MTDEWECGAHDPDIPEITEVGTNPGWRIRVGVSRRVVEVLAEADKRGIWFDTEAELDAFVEGRLQAYTSGDGECVAGRDGEGELSPGC